MKTFYTVIFFCISYTTFAQPASFNLTSPANGAYASATPYLVWSAASGANYYQLYIDGTLKKDNITNTYYQIQNTETISEGLHTWDIKAVNGSGSIQSVETWSMRVDATLPSAFDLISPPHNSWTSSLRPTFQWSASSDAVSGLAKYQLWIDSTLNVDNISASATSIAPANPLFNGSHSWQIKAIDNVGNVRTSTQNWTVKVDNLPPGLSDPYALQFSGTGDYVYVGSSSALNMTYNKTIEVWLCYFAGGNNSPRIISKQTDDWGQPGDYALWTDGTGTSRTITFWIQGIGQITTSDNIVAGSWHHIAATISGNQASSQMKLYIDGNLSANANTSGTHTPTSTPLVFGRKGYPNGNNLDLLNGIIDEARIWNFCKTQSQIQQQYNVPLIGNETGLVGYWKFDEGSGTIAYDQTGNNNGTIYGASYNNQSLPNINFLCNLNNPTSNKYLSTPTTTFSWGSSTDAGIGFQKFQLWIDGALNKDNLSDSSWTITFPLSYGQHTWFVKGFDALGNNQSSYSRTFYVDNQPPNPFNLLSPNDSAVVSIPTPNLSWQATTDSAGGSGLSKYQLWINGSKNIDSISASSTTTSPSSPLSEGSYAWFVKAYDNVGNVRQSTQTRLFYVDFNPPTSFNLVSPAQNDTVTTRRPLFQWHRSFDVGSGIAKYELNISGQSVITVPATDTIKLITFDLSDGNYTWYVKAYDRGGNTSSSNTNAFTVYVPLPPTLTYPSNNASVGDDLTPDFAWNTVPNANYFDVQVATDSLFSNIAAENKQVLTLNWTPTLTYYGKYYWRACTHTTLGFWGTWSETRSFSIALSVPLLAFPQNGAVNQSTNQKLGWSKSPNSAYFHLQVSTDSNFVTGLFNDTTITDTSFVVKGLTNNIKYYWRVRAANAVGISDYSIKWSFVTIVAIPNIPQLALPLDNATNQLINISLKWNKAQRATSYQLQLATDSLFANLIINDSTLTDTLRLVSSLSNNVTYYWKVLAKDIAGPSNWSAIRKFTT